MKRVPRLVAGLALSTLVSASFLPAQDLSLTFSNPPATGGVGTPLSFVLNVGGAGTGVAVTVIFHPPVTFNSPASCSPNAGTDSTTVICYPLAGSSVTLNVTPLTVGTLRVAAGVVSDGSDPIMTNNSMQISTSVSAVGPPTGFGATQNAETSILVSWVAPPGGAQYYELQRKTGLAGAWATITPANYTQTSFTDTPSAPAPPACKGETFFYQVRASQSGNWSPYSSADPAPILTDYAIVQFQTVVKACHVTELRKAIDVRRAMASLGTAPWAPATISAGLTIARGHVQDLRTYLDQAIGAGAYTENPLPANPPGTTIKKQHIQELRNRVQ